MTVKKYLKKLELVKKMELVNYNIIILVVDLIDVDEEINDESISIAINKLQSVIHDLKIKRKFFKLQ